MFLKHGVARKTAQRTNGCGRQKGLHFYKIRFDVRVFYKLYGAQYKFNEPVFIYE